MRFLKWIIPLLILLGAIVVRAKVVKMRPKTPEAERIDRKPSVRVMTASQQNYRPSIFTQGTVRPKTSIELVPEVAGKIIWVSSKFSNGGQFTKDETLLRIDPRNYQFAIEAANANVANAEAALAKEIAEGDIAKQDWEDISGGRPASDLALRKPQLAGAKAVLASARAAYNKAKLDLTRTNIQAPFNGRVDVKRTGLGQYVTLGKVLADLYSVDSAEIFLPITNAQLSKIDLAVLETKSGIPVKLSAEVAGKPARWTGKIIRTAGSVDQNSRVLRMIVEVKKPYTGFDTPLRNGMFVQAEIPGTDLENVVKVPRSALRGGNSLAVLDSDNKLWTRSIIIAHSDKTNVYLRGLDDGERVVTSPLEILIEGSEANIVAAPGGAP